jgi:PilZ domain
MTRHRTCELERRRDERVSGKGLRARVRPGYRLLIIDLSCSGALVEAGRPLRPGSYVDLHLESEARAAMVAARVVRCAVAAIDSEIGVTYRAALCFRESCDWVREALPPGGHGIPAEPADEGAGSTAGGDRIHGGRDEAIKTQARVPK